MAEYDLPAWLNTNPAELYSGIIQRSRQLDQTKQDRAFEQKRETAQDEMARQQFQQQTAAAARKLAADTEFSQGVQSLDPTASDYQQKYLGLMLNHAAKTGQYGAGMGATINALKPVQKPQYTPFPGGGGDVAQPPSASTQLPNMPGSGKPTEIPSTQPPAQTLTPPGANNGGFVTDAKGNVHIVRPPTPPHQFPPARAIVTRPGEVALDPKTFQPVYTNNVPKQPSAQVLADKEFQNLLMEERAANANLLKHPPAPPDSKDKAAAAAHTEAVRAYNAAHTNLEQYKQNKGQSEKPKANEVTRETKDGKKAVFDADTKKFLRYAD